MIIIVLLTFFIPSVFSQPKCSAFGIPSDLPALIDQHLILDLNRYFQGPNLTLSLQSSSPNVKLYEKYVHSEQKHILGNILQIISVQQTVSMLGASSTGRFNIYYAPIQNPHNLSVKQVPSAFKKCSNHAISPNQQYVAITCQTQIKRYGKIETVNVLAYTKLRQQKPWQIQYMKQFQSGSKQIEYVSDTKVAIIVSDPFNSYIQLWDTNYGRIIAIFDRVYFSLPYLNIVDVQMTAGKLYILDYQYGVFKLQLEYDRFKILQNFAFSHYSKMTVHINTIVVAKKGSITQFNGKQVFKYQSVGSQPAKQLIVSDQYILVYTNSQVISYLRGFHTAYFTIPTRVEIIAGTFGNNSRVIQSISVPNQVQVSIQEILLNSPELIIPSTVPDNTSIQVSAKSTVGDNQENCKLTFRLVRTDEKDYQIFDTQYNRNGTEHIFMNRPGRTEIDLSPYGMGPDLDYRVSKFAESVNVTAQVRKRWKVEKVTIEGLQKQSYTIKGTYFSDTCGLYKRECPMVIDAGNINMVRMFLCQLQIDQYGITHRISCTQKFKYFKLSQFTHYQLQQPQNQLDTFIQISVGRNTPNQISINKYEIEPSFFTLQKSSKLTVGDNETLFGNNITQLEFDQQNNILYILLLNMKEIQAFQIKENSDSFDFVLRFKINSQSLSGRYFSPRGFELDTDGGLWVKCFDEILIFDFRQMESIGKPQILSTLKIDINHVKTYNYFFEVVQKRRKLPLFSPIEPALSKGQERNYKHLVIYGEENTLLVSTVNQLYEIEDKNLQPLPKYGYFVPKDPKQQFIQSLGNSQIFVSLIGFGIDKYNMIYNLDSMSLVSCYYTSIKTKNTAIPSYFHLSSSNPVVFFIDSTVVGQSQLEAYQISQSPRMLLSVSDMVGQSDLQYLLLNVQNEKVSIRHSVVLSISNSPEKLKKGGKYPYSNIKTYAKDKYIQVDTTGWANGNSLSISYVCDKCKKPTDPQDSFVDVKGKLWTQHNFDLAGGQQLSVIKTSTGQSLIAIARNNMIYTFNTELNTITAAYQVTQNEKDQILQYKFNAEKQILLSALLTENRQIVLVSYGASNFKGFQLSKITMPSVKYVLNIDYKQNLAAILGFNSVYLVSINNEGAIYIVDDFNQIEAGGSICWVELFNSDRDQEYNLLLTLCQTGVTYISLKLQDFQILTIINKQTLDLKSQLSNINIRIPTDSTFRRSIVNYSPDVPEQMSLIMIIKNFNSFEWTIRFRNKVVYYISVKTIIHRFGDFGATQSISIGGEQKRFMVITYIGKLDKSDKNSQFIHAVYDLNDVSSEKTEKYSHCYIMEAFLTKKNKSPQFTDNRTLLVMSDDAHHLDLIDTDNKFRALIINQQKLISQSVFIIPSNPISTMRIEISIKGIDLVYWQIWQILILVLSGIILLSISVFLIKACLSKYKMNKKLIPLLVDYAQYEEDLEQQFQRNLKEQKRQNTDTNTNANIQQVVLKEKQEDDQEQSSKNNINASDRGSTNM